MNWGSCYSVVGLPVEAVAAIIEQQIARFGAVTERSQTNGRVCIRGRIPNSERSSRHGPAIKLLWQVSADQHGVAIRSDWHWSRLTQLLIAIGLASAGVTWVMGIDIAASGIVDTTIESFGLMARGMALTIPAALLAIGLTFIPKGRRERRAITDGVKRAIAARGSHLEPIFGRSRSREAAILLLALLTVAGSVVYSFARWDVLVFTSTPGIGWHLSWLLLCSGAVCLVALSVFGLASFIRRGFARRSYPAQLGMLTLLALASAMAGFVILSQLGHAPNELWRRVWLTHRHATQHVPVLEGDRWISSEELHRMLYSTRLGFGVLLAGSLVPWALGGIIMLWGLRLALPILEDVLDLRRSGDVVARSAKIGRGLLRPMRILSTALWLMAWSAILAMWISLVFMASARPWWSPASDVVQLGANDGNMAAEVGLIEGTAQSISLLLGTEQLHATRSVARAVWAIALVFLPALVATSLVDAIRSRRRLRRVLQKGVALVSDPRHAAALAQFEGLRSRYMIVPVSLSIIHNCMPHAAAYEFGVWRRDRVVAITTGCLDVLEEDELSALMAHELSHLHRGDCARHRSLWMASRVTLVGDAFVSVLEDSFGLELAADRHAIDRFGIPAEALIRCLWKMYTAAALVVAATQCSLAASASAQLLPVDMYVRQPSPEVCAPARMRDYIRAWLVLFRGDHMFVYWHPSVKDRIAHAQRWLTAASA